MNDFNYDYAADVYDLISKMEDGEAQLFAQFVGYDVLMNDIEANRRTLDSLSGRIVKSLRDEVSKQLLTNDSPESLAAAAVVGSVVKSQDDPNTRYWDARDASGRFASANRGSKFSVTVTREKNKGDRGRGKQVNIGTPAGSLNLTGALGASGEHGGAFAHEWQNAASSGSNNSQTYARIQAGSKLLGALPGSPHLQAAAQVGEFVGQYGPEAEKVVGPSIRSTAYRYRGTERKIDKNLVNLQQASVVALARNEGVDYTKISPEMREQATKSAAIQYFLGGTTITGDRIQGRLPSKRLSELQAKSGKLPPSEGVIIDRNGKVVTQATGFMEDHYLPFNLKNLKGLKDGSYVRTRSSGGLTTEDIYTGLVAGADSVTVVSRSGIFTVNFDKDFKGGRRYNDKARKMVSQYGKTLDAIKSEQVSRRGLTPDERIQIRDDVEEEMGSWASQKQITDRIKEREREFKAAPELTKQELANIDVLAKDAYPDDERKQKIARMDLIDSVMEKKAANKYRLDGEGYATALQAMQEQFPYYIDSVQFQFRDPDNPTEATSRLSTEKDRGYVKPKHNRPEGVSEGYFDNTINGTGKMSADKTNYQNYSNRKRAEAGQPATASASAVTKPPIAPRDKVRANVAHAKAQNESDKALKDLIDHGASIMEPKEVPMLTDISSGTVTLADVLADPVKKAKMDDELALANRTISAKGEEEDKTRHQVLRRTYETTRKLVGGKEFDPDAYRFGDSPSEPFTYDDGPAYKLGSPAADYQREWAKQEHRSGLAGKFSDQSSDEDLRKAANFAGSVVAAAKQAKETGDIDHTLTQVLVRNSPDDDIVNDIVRKVTSSPGAADSILREYQNKVDALERMRRIKVSSASGSIQNPEPSTSTGVEPGPVKGRVVSSSTDRDKDGPMSNSDLLNMSRNAADAYREHNRARAATYDSLHHALRKSDIDTAMEVLQELPEKEADFWMKSLKKAGYDV